MLKITGAIIIITVSFGLGFVLCDNYKKRLKSVILLESFVDHISMNIQLYKTPLDEIYRSVTNPDLIECGFVKRLDLGIYSAARDSGLLYGDEEAVIIKTFDEKLGGGNTDDMTKLCSFTNARLKNIEEKLTRELPDKQRIYRTISALAGASLVIMLI